MNEVKAITDSINNLATRTRRLESAPSPNLHYMVLDNAIGDGVTDNTNVLQAAINEANAAGGKTIVIPPGTYIINSQIVFPVADWEMRPTRLTGFGNTYNGNAGTPINGTIIDLRYNGPGVAKIDTRGYGCLELDHITFKDDGVSSLPFIQSTNTELMIHDCEFYGNPTKSGVTCDQDAIVLGGTDTTADLSDDAPFQGYGTVIERNYFGRIRRGVYGRTYCNGVVIQNNMWWGSCGGVAAIEYLGIVASKSSGGLISGNLLEVPYYDYGMKFDYVEALNIIGNNFYDYTGALIAYIRFEANAINNLVIDGRYDDATLAVSDAGTGNSRMSSRFGAGISMPQAAMHSFYPTPMPPSLTFNTEAGAILRTENSEIAMGLHNASPWPYWIQGRTHTNAVRDVVLQPLGGKIGIGTADPKSVLHVVGLPVYANNAAAVGGGLAAGAFYRTGGDPDLVCVVH